MPNLGMAEILILCIVLAFIVAAVAGLVWVLVSLSRRNTATQAQRDLEARVSRLEGERQRPD